MLDDIDYSALEASTEAPKAKPAVAERSVIKKDRLERKKIDEEALGKKADILLESMGQPESGDLLTQYALPAIGILGGLATAYGLWKKGESNADYSKESGPKLSVPADNKGTSAVSSVEQNVAQSEQVNRIEQLQNRAKANKELGIGVQPPVGPTYNVPTANVPQVGIQAPVAAPVQAPMGAVAPQQAPATVTEAVTTGVSPSKAVQTDVAQMIDAAPTESGVKKRAAKVQQTFKSEAAIPPGSTFRADIGNLDRSLYNVLGPEHRRNAMELLNQGKPFGNVSDVNAAVKDITSRYWQTVQSQIPETLLGREERAAQGLKSEFGNYGALGKAAKVAGVAGTLLSIADLAKAAQQTKEGKYVEAAKTVVPVIDPTGLGTAAVQPQNTAQMLTGVSPLMGILTQLIGSQTAAKR